MLSCEGQSVARWPGGTPEMVTEKMNHPSFRTWPQHPSTITTVPLYLPQGCLAPVPTPQLLAATHLPSLLCVACPLHGFCHPWCDLVWLAAFVYHNASGPIPGKHMPALLSVAGVFSDVKRTLQLFLSGKTLGCFCLWQLGAFIPFLHRCDFSSWSGMAEHMRVLFFPKPLCHFTVLLVTWFSCQLLFLYFSYPSRYKVLFNYSFNLYCLLTNNVEYVLCVYYFYIAVIFGNDWIHLGTF